MGDFLAQPSQLRPFGKVGFGNVQANEKVLRPSAAREARQRGDGDAAEDLRAFGSRLRLNIIQKTKKFAAKGEAMKKSYVRPQLVKHGNVESLTQLIGYGPSCPINL